MIELGGCTINNFKSLDKFNLDFSKFTCLIGLNSAGKSTILQAIDFISQQMKGDITGWLKDRNWEAKELKCKLINNRNILIVINFDYHGKFYVWLFIFNHSLKKVIHEYITYIPDLNFPKKEEIMVMHLRLVDKYSRV